MKLIDITSEQLEDTIELIKAGRDCTLKIYLLNDEYKVIHVYASLQNRVSVSHLLFNEVPQMIIKYLIEDFLKTYRENVFIYSW